jgi:oxygen-dependent protoporphyrinogen oxidase
VNVGYTRKVIRQRGFGYLVASQENEEVMGVIFDSNSFAQFNRTPEETRLTVLLKREDLSDNEARDIALRSLKKHLQITETPTVSMVARAPNVFPQLRVGHAKKIEAIEKMVREKYPNLHLVGNYFYGVGVSDCISRAQSVAENFLSATVS